LKALEGIDADALDDKDGEDEQLAELVGWLKSAIKTKKGIALYFY
jgi:hypothetical protein